MIDPLHGYGPLLLEGARMTVLIAIAAEALSLLVGLTAALLRLYGRRFGSSVALTYTTIVRGVPDLVLMLLIYYGGQALVNALAAALGHDGYIDINPFLAGIVTLAFVYGGYQAETFRGAILAVPHGQIEAGRAYGMGRAKVLVRIILPQMIRHALPGLTNNWLVLLKATALVSLIGLEDIVRKAALAAGATREPFTFYLAACAFYLLFTSVSIVLLRRIERRYSAGFV